MKAEYWSDPAGWSDKQIQDARIGIETVANEARALLQLAVPKPAAKAGVQQDASHLFLSHASEDKESIVEPLVVELKKCGLEVWYDRFNLKLGDNLRTELDKALQTCRYGIVILSENFFAKEWTQMELNALLALETSDRRKRILPIRHGLSHQDLVGRSPLLAGRVTMSTDAGLPALTQSIISAIRDR